MIGDTINFDMTGKQISAIVMKDFDLTNDFNYDFTAVGSDGLKYDIYAEWTEDQVDWWCVPVGKG